MRILKLCTVLGLVLATAGTASAIPLMQPYNGPFFMHIKDWSQGTVYQVDPLTKKPILLGGGLGNIGQAYTPAELAAPAYPTLAGNAGETGWSVFVVDSIEIGEWKGPNNIQGTGTDLYTDGFGGVELVGTIFGRTDSTITFYASGAQEIEFTGDRMTVYEQTHGTFDYGAAGSSGRIPALGSGVGGPYDTLYDSVGKTWVDDGDGIVEPGEVVDTPGSDMILTGLGEPGYFGLLATTEGYSLFTPAGGTGSGTVDEFFSFDGGSELVFFDTDGFTPTKGVLFDPADLRVHVTDAPVTVVGTFDWLTTSSDPVTGTIVPEPMTMFSALAGVSALVGYIRKRR